MRKDKSATIQLRRLGKSYNEIKRELGIPISTLSEWLRDSHWSAEIRKVLERESREGHIINLQNLNTIRGKYLKRLYREARKEARVEYMHFKFHPLFIAGISIYCGEGDKASRNIIKIANVDPAMIRLFVKFLRAVCGMPKARIKAYVLLYHDLSDKLCKDYWAHRIGLGKENFNKSVLIQGRHKTRRVRYGVCNVGVSSTYLKEKMRVWLNLLPREFIKGEYYGFHKRV